MKFTDLNREETHETTVFPVIENPLGSGRVSRARSPAEVGLAGADTEALAAGSGAAVLR